MAAIGETAQKGMRTALEAVREVAMRSWKCLSLVLVAIGVSLALSAWSQEEQHKHDVGTGEKLGRANFRVSCNAAAQKEFERAVAMLHSFWYEEIGRASCRERV